MLVYVIRMYKM